ncbi:MAG: DNA-processing protein DprA, partial [Lachnospiraceae bacterium]|nr:DNA-processing protein DprA [Lachnospiraceae bacterium]
ILYERLCEDGGVMSEIYPSVQPMKAFFAQRNRLISGMSDCVCVVEAKEKSGTLITVDCALEQGREVFAVPGRISDITSFGTNELINQGAGMITDIDGFMEDFTNRYCVPAVKTPINKEETESKLCKNLNKNEIRVIKAIDENSFTPDQLSEVLLLPAYEVLSLCISLTGKAFLKNVGAGRFMPMQKAVDIKNYLTANSLC